jgi:hypothetical protein
MADMLTVDDAKQLAASQLSCSGQRWTHVTTVGRLAQSVVGAAVGPDVLAAAWLHDVGYAPSLARVGFHPLDGARFLQDQGAPANVVALVAHHTGARFEAEERGLVDELDGLPSPASDDLDALTLLDLVVGPSGELTTPEQRIAEILTRYGPEDPVHRAVTRSRASLLASAQRARARLGLSDEWPLDVAEGVLES